MSFPGKFVTVWKLSGEESLFEVPLTMAIQSKVFLGVNLQSFNYLWQRNQATFVKFLEQTHKIESKLK